jgi:lantibiotic biosynthesis protein
MGTLTATDTARLRAAADRAADVLVANAITADGRSTWLAATVDWVDDGLGVVHRTGDASLYDGTAGIAIAGWSVAAALGRDDLAEVAVGAARHAMSARGRLGGIGLFDGLAGVGLAAVEVGSSAGDEPLRRDGLDLLGVVAEAVPSGVDLISGSAGVILALLAAARRTGSDRWLAPAARHAEHLLATAEQYAPDWGWRVPAAEGPMYCGLAHGAAGIAWALGELAAVVDDDRLLEAVDRARRYERSWFQPVHNSWPDLRPETSPPGSPAVCPALWCHGATGIGLSRMALFGLDEHPSLAAEAAAALQSVTAAASQSLQGYPEEGLTVCHGLGGTLLLLLAAHQVLGESEHLAASRWVAERALDRLGDQPAAWPSGVRGGGFSPGLMTGLAGTAYVLARVADPTGTDALRILGDHPAVEPERSDFRSGGADPPHPVRLSVGESAPLRH